MFLHKLPYLTFKYVSKHITLSQKKHDTKENCMRYAETKK